MKIIHRFWGGGHMPDNYKEFGERWKELNPDWKVVLWQPSYKHIPYVYSSIGASRIINDYVWNKLASPPEGMKVDKSAMWTQRADVLGYELLYRYGGLYVNTDIEPIRPLSELFDNDISLDKLPAAAREDDQWLVNAVMWAPEPKMLLYKECMQAVRQRFNLYPHEYMNVTTGPHLLTEVASRVPTVALDKEAFSHVHWSQVEAGKDAVFNINDLPAGVIGIHHWGHRKSGRPQTSWV